MRLLEQAAFALQECAAQGQCWSRLPLRTRRVDGSGMGRAALAYTERLRSSLMALISIFLRPMVTANACDQTSRRIRLDAIRSTVMGVWLV